MNQFPIQLHDDKGRGWEKIPWDIRHIIRLTSSQFKGKTVFVIVMIQIKSPSNPKIKHLVRLRKSSRYRHEVGQFIVEGDREMEALFSFGRELKEIYFTNDALKNSPLSHVLPKLSQYISIFEVNEACMKKISYKDQTKYCWCGQYLEIEASRK